MSESMRTKEDCDCKPTQLIWNNSTDRLPNIKDGKGIRCLGICHTEDNTNIWKGYIDVFFNPHVGWRRCEDEKIVCVLKWVYLKDLNFPDE